MNITYFQVTVCPCGRVIHLHCYGSRLRN